ncbi:hypothetical protein L208DRAFT_1312457, partial [Tricholoma matsutake]
YVTGGLPQPTSAEPQAHSNWRANSCLAYTVITSGKERLVRQVVLLQQALSIQCMTNTPLPKTAEKICMLIEWVFAMGSTTPDLLCCIVLLNSLSANFPHAHSIISRDIVALMVSAPYTLKNICLFLENEQSLQENNHNIHNTYSLALAISSKPPRLTSAVICSNCKHPGHIVPYCVSNRGGMEGKTIEESKAVKKLAYEQKKSGNGAAKSSPKIPITLKDSAGHAYTVMLDSSILSTTQAVPTKFAGLTSDPLPHTMVEEVEYKEWLMTEEEFSTSVDWV